MHMHILLTTTYHHHYYHYYYYYHYYCYCYYYYYYLRPTCMAELSTPTTVACSPAAANSSETRLMHE